MRVAINGMGRIGRLLFRRLLDNTAIDLVAVNDIMDGENLAYLIKYDSIYGTFQRDVSAREGALKIGDREVLLYREMDPMILPWGELDIDLVLEASGRFASLGSAAYHLDAGAKRVLLTTTGAKDIPLYIYRFGEKVPLESERIFAAGGCMTNCSVPVLDELRPLGIQSVHIHVLHSYTSRQGLVDSAHNQFRRGRAAAESIIPVDIDLAVSLERLLDMEGKIAASSTRIPVANGAMADFVVQVDNGVQREDINHLFKSAAFGSKKGILDYTEDPVVSLDLKANVHSVIIDSSLTAVAGNQVRIVGWFDNEYGYTSRIIDWIFWLVNKMS